MKASPVFLMVLAIACHRDKGSDTAEGDLLALPSGVTATLNYDEETLAIAGIEAADLSMEAVAFSDEDDPSSEVVQDLGGAIVELGPDGTRFPKPIYLQMALPGSDVPAELPTLTIARWETDRWRALPTTIEETDSGLLLSAQVDHFSRAALFGTLNEPGEMRVSAAIAATSDGRYSGELEFSGSPVNDLLGAELVRMEDDDTEGERIEAICPDAPDFSISLDLPEAGLYRIKYAVGGENACEFNLLPTLEFWSREIIADASVTDGDDESLVALADQYLPVFQFAAKNDSEDAMDRYGGVPAERWRPVALDETYFARPLTMMGGGAPVAGSEYENLDGWAAIDALASLGQEGSTLTSRRSGEHFVSTAWSDWNPGDPGDDEMVVYWSAHESDLGELLITYWTFYVHDPKTNSPGENDDGAHDRDRESITVVLSAGTRTPSDVIYAQHNTGTRMSAGAAVWLGDALSVPWDDVDRFGTHPLAYVAGGSHAVYPRQGDYLAEAGPLYYFEALERAGGGVTYCPTDGCRDWFSDEAADDTVSVTDEDIRLEPLPKMTEVDGVSSPWRHLWFSGYWVDGTFWYNDRFPPFLNRYWDPGTWRADVESRNEDFEMEALGEATVIEDCWNGEDDDGDGDLDCIDSDCAALQYDYEEEFEIPEDPPVDIMFVVDQSCSMDDDVRALATQFSTFIDRLDLYSTDWQIIVANNDEGCTQSELLTPDTPDYEALFTDAVTECDARLGCTHIIDTEALLLPAAEGVENTDAGECNEAFMRDGALLHVIAVSDEPDQSACGDYDIDCTDSDWENLVAQIQDKKGSSALTRISAVAGDLPDGCSSAGNSAEAGTGYAEAADATGGEFLSLCSSWSDNVETLAAASYDQDTFVLGHTPVEETISVSLNGEALASGWRYDADINAVIIVEVTLYGGDLVQISYTASAAPCE